jgi:hypothetical protein
MTNLGTNVYSFIWERLFLIDDKSISKRVEFYSNTTKQLGDFDNQHVNFILRNISDDNDYVSVEEKSSRKGVKSDIKKGKALQAGTLYSQTPRNAYPHKA